MIAQICLKHIFSVQPQRSKGYHICAWGMTEAKRLISAGEGRFANATGRVTMTYAIKQALAAFLAFASVFRSL
jgi:hypothetical protein